MQLRHLVLAVLLIPTLVSAQVVRPLRFIYAPAGSSYPLTCGGTTVFSDNFDDNDITDWAITGSVVASGGVATSSSAAAQYATNTYGGTHHELWGTWDFTHTWTVWSNSVEQTYGGFRRSSDTAVQLQLGAYNTAGSRTFRIVYREDSGNVGSTTAYAIGASGTSYHVKFYIKHATNTTSLDGILRVWVDGGSYSNTLIFEKTDADNYTSTVDRWMLGNYPGSGNVTGSVAHDNVLVCTTEPT